MISPMKSHLLRFPAAGGEDGASGGEDGASGQGVVGPLLADCGTGAMAGSCALDCDRTGA